MINTIEIRWDLLGAKLALLSDIEQAEFFTGFACELGSPSYESHFKREMQMMCVNRKLDASVKEVLKEYFPALWFEQEMEN